MSNDKPKMTLLSLTPEERQTLKKLSENEGTTMTEIVRRAIRLYEQMDKQAEATRGDN